MTPIATILYATDFSPLSEQAFQLACSLARDLGSRLIILHVAELPVVTASGEVLTTPLPGGIREALTDQLRRIQAADLKISIEHRLEEGNAPAEILRVARETKSDLIVMGTHGRTGVARLLMGSVAEQVAQGGMPRAACENAHPGERGRMKAARPALTVRHRQLRCAAPHTEPIPNWPGGPARGPP